MSMKPILFSTKMVQAILSGRKTQTRRVVKPQPEYIELSGRWVWPIPKSKIRPGCCESVCSASREWWEYLMPEQTPYQLGDILWVRETWGYARGGLHPVKGIGCNEILYKATDDSDDVEHWRSPIYMPKWAARIFLRVTEIRAERVWDISVEDAVAEGFTGVPCGHSSTGMYGCTDCMNTGYTESPQVEFMDTWEALNAKRGYGWDKNPWVWVYTFEQVERPENWRDGNE